MEKLRVGVVGCGAISGIYFRNMLKYVPLSVVACADLDEEKAQRAAMEYECEARSVDDLLSSEDVELILNLTVPKAHAEVNLKALQAGKHVYVEKPLAVTRQDGQRTLELAREKGLLVGAAPDTVLGAGIQTCRKLIDDGAIGEPIGAQAFMMCHGHESWHPSPEFYYEVGGGPMFDMGPYYLSALITLLGPVRRVTGSARASFPQRRITSQPKSGKVIDVETPTHIVGVMDFESGAIGSITTSFDVWSSRYHCIEIYGTEGSLAVPDPNSFGGPVEIRGAKDEEWREVPLAHGFSENSRGLGVMDMAYAIRRGRPHRANGELAYHVLDVMHAFLDASEQGKHQAIQSGVPKPQPMAQNLPPNDLQE